MKLLIGTAGWSYKDWEGVVYPHNLKRSGRHPVEYLAQFIDTIEINTSFYGHIRPELGKLWCSKARGVNKDFQFTAKLHKSFTHSPIAVIESTSAATIKTTDEDERLAKEGLDSIANQHMLGAVLVQFPISFKNTNENRDHLETVLAKFRAYPLVVEVRHASWNNEGILKYFTEKGVSFCNIDQPRLGQAIGKTEHVTAPVGYIRLHGRNYKDWFESDNRDDRYNYLYTAQELEGWKGKIENVAKKAEVTFVVANNHFQGKAVVNAIQLKKMAGQPARAPEILAEHYPELKDAAEVVTS